MAEQIAQLKRQRRNRKGHLTRTLKLLRTECGGEKKDLQLLKNLLRKSEEVFQKIEEVHQTLVDVIEKDDEFEAEEQWMEACQVDFREVHRSVKQVIEQCEQQTKPNAEAEDGQVQLNQEGTEAELQGNQNNSLNNEQGDTSESRGESSSLSEILSLKLSLELPKAHVQEFYGDPGDYWTFMSNFKTNVASKLRSDEGRLQYLLQLCKGKARSCIDSCALLGAEGYQRALAILKKQFGQPHLVLNSLMGNLLKRKQILSGDSEGLWSLVAAMKKCHITLTKMGYVSDLNSTSNLLKVQSLLPKYLQAKWANVAHGILAEREPTFGDILKFLEGQAEVSSTMFGRQIEGAEVKTKGKDSKPDVKSHRVYQTNVERKPTKQSTLKCVCCDGSHKLWECKKFRAMGVSERWDLASREKLCFKCFGNHRAAKCSREMLCGIDGCKSDHNRLLHKSGKTLQPNSNHSEVGRDSPTEGEHDGLNRNSPTEREEGMVMHNDTFLSHQQNISLRTVPVVVSNGGKSITVNAMLDDGSNQSYINADLCEELGLRGEEDEVVANLLNGKEEKFLTKPVRFNLSPVDRSKRYTIHALTINQVTGKLVPTEWKTVSKDWEHLRDIEFPEVAKNKRIDILVGTDHPHLHRCLEERYGSPGEPIARLTPLGWTCIGRVSQTFRRTNLSLHANTYKANVVDADAILQKFWEVDNTGIKGEGSFHTREEKAALDMVSNSMKLVEEGKYQINIPWKENKQEMVEQSEKSLMLAQKRLDNLEKKLTRDKELGDAYKKVIENYVEKEYVRKIQADEEIPEQQWYLPHFPVVRLDRQTTKVRVVFDASAESKGVSLNDIIYSGPKLQNDLFDVMLRFRRNEVGIICDISEMYLQIMIAPEDRPMFRFLWRNLEPEREPDIYEFNRLVFGTNAAPFISQIVSQRNAKSHAHEFPLASETILESTYMDDCMDSVYRDGEGIKLYNELSALWARAGMSPRKWLSNSRKVMAEIPEQHRAKELKLTENEWPSVKTLGLTWMAELDVFVFKGPERVVAKGKVTKRSVLSHIASLFDPMGFLAPVITTAKILMQEIWVSGISWDEVVSEPIVSSVEKWVKDLEGLKGIEVPRCIGYASQGTEIHVFVDASKDAYAAVAYTRYKNQGQTEVKLISSKTKVAPLKSVSIPRLELMGAMLGLKLAKSITKVLKHELKDVIFWCDSHNVLWWIRGRSRSFKPFVANRVGEIQHQTNPSQWRYVPTKSNPADIASRGSTVTKLKEDQKWWNGPDFLKGEPGEWPNDKIDCGGFASVEQKQWVTMLQLTLPLESSNDFRLNPTRFANWTKLTRVLAYVCRFINNCRVKKESRCGGLLSAEEISDARISLISQAQNQAFGEDIKNLKRNGAATSNSVLSSLLPHIDEDGIIRMTGRLSLVETLPYDVRYPIILPRKHHITKLIVKEYHEKSNHVAGTNHLLALISEKYWLVHGREEIRDCEKSCVTCKKRTAKPARQIMAPLPKERASTSSLRAFNKVAVDYAGPFLTVQGRGKTRTKRYLCLFTCLSTRAVHLELAYGLDTDTFLNAFYRFVSRRGQPEEVLSDNGSNFVGAERELREVFEVLNKTKVEEVTSRKGIKWRFIPPLTPHFGGVHESLVKSAKRAIYAILQNADIYDEELHSAIVGAEGMINSRPLTYMSASPKDLVPLTPNHFLHGSMGGQFASVEVIDGTKSNMRNRWRRVQELMRHFWHRWLKEWLPSLNRRKKWKAQKPDLKVNDMVLTMEKDTVRGQWPLGRIIEVYPGKDGHVRVVKVRTKKGELIRNITKVCPLEIVN